MASYLVVNGSCSFCGMGVGREEGLLFLSFGMSLHQGKGAENGNGSPCGTKIKVMTL